MHTLILIISLKSQFNHSLDVRITPNLPTKEYCTNIANITIQDLLKFNPSVETKYECI